MFLNLIQTCIKNNKFLKVRHDGNYGDIFVVVNSLNQTARRNVDFLLPSTGVKVHFTDGQTAAHFNVTLIDDLLVENEEKFTLVLTDATDGVKIGKKKFLEVMSSHKYNRHCLFMITVSSAIIDFGNLLMVIFIVSVVVLFV